MHFRHRKIMEMLQTDRLYIKDAAETLGVSEMTLRRDLRELEEKNLVMMIKGGAVMHPSHYEPKKSSENLTPEKFALAETLYDEIMPAESIFIGSGFTALAFAKLLARRRSGRLTVITNSLPAAAALFQTNHTVILPGGTLRNNSLELIGKLAEQNLNHLRVDWMIAGCDGASAESGFGTCDPDLSELKQHLINLATHTAVITESQKFSVEPVNCFAAPYQVDLLVTDSGLESTDASALRSSGMRVVVRDVRSNIVWR